MRDDQQDDFENAERIDAAKAASAQERVVGLMAALEEAVNAAKAARVAAVVDAEGGAQ